MTFSIMESNTLERMTDTGIPDNAKPIANPLAVLREEFDNWAILFDPATGNAFGLNPVGVLLRKGPGQVCSYQLKQYSKGPADAFRSPPCPSKTF